MGTALDSRRYGPVPVSALVGRAWFRYGPLRRVGLIAAGPGDLLDRGRGASMPVPEAAQDDETVAPGGAPET